MATLPKRLRQARAQYQRQQRVNEHSDCKKIIKQSGPHFGLYCEQHGTWFKWLNEQELVNLGAFTEDQLDDYKQAKRMQNTEWDTSPWV
jgi:hypothetical protein